MFTLSSWIQRRIQSIILFPQIWKLQNSIFLGRSWQKCACTIPDGENMQIPCTHGAPFSSLLSRNGSCLPLQNILGLEVDGMDQAAAYCTGRSTPSCAHETANACVREHSRSTLPRRLSFPGLIVMTFQRLSSRRIQSSRPSETFACPAWDRDEYLPGFANSKSSPTLTHGVTLLHLNRRPPKHSKTALFLFFSIVGL